MAAAVTWFGVPSGLFGLRAIYKAFESSLIESTGQRSLYVHEEKTRPWQLRGDAMELKASELKKRGYLEVAVLVQRLGWTRVDYWCFYSAEHRTFAVLHRGLIWPGLTFRTRLENGTLVTTCQGGAQLWRGSSALNLQHFTGSLKGQNMHHHSVVESHGDPPMGEGTSAQVMAMIEREAQIRFGVGVGDWDETPKLDWPPRGLQVEALHHCISVTVPGRANQELKTWWRWLQWFMLTASGLLMMAEVMDSVTTDVGIFLWLVVMFVNSRSTLKWEKRTANLNITTTRIDVVTSLSYQPNHSIALEDIARATLVNGELVLVHVGDDRSKDLEVPGYGAAIELRWLILVIETALTQHRGGVDGESREPPKALRELLGRVAARVPRAVDS